MGWLLPVADPVAVRDFWPRVLLTPVFGTVIPVATGLIDPARHNTAGLLFSFIWFTGTAWVVWEGNRRIYLRLPHREDWLQRPWRRIRTLLGAIVLFTIPVSSALLLIWRLVTGDTGARPFAMPTAVLAIVTSVLVVTHVYETVFLLRDWESDRLKSARLERARMESEFEVLRREVDPHFLFNNLNALVHLIEQGHPQALPFIEALSASYRYVLEARSTQLVTLQTELAALRRHLILTNIRYADAVALTIDVPRESVGRLWLPPVTLGELLQNAVKHNELSTASPLQVTVSLHGTTLVFANEYRPRRQPFTSTGLGLRNLAERHGMATGLRMSWQVADDRFVVHLPLAVEGPAGQTEADSRAGSHA